MDKKEVFCLILILGLASFFRLWQLGKIPPGLYPDEAINANEGFFSLKNKDFKVFYPENYGREGLFIWLLAFSFSIFGVSIFSLKIVPALIGILTVIGLYFLAKELFSNKLALLSAFFLAISFWHINFSRIGFRAILVPFILVFSFYFLLRTFKRKSVLNSLISGIFFGLGFYTYTSFRMAVLILPFLFLSFWFLSKKEGWQKKFFLITLSFLFATFFVALPIGIYFLKNPEHFGSRALPVMIFSAESPTKEFLKSLILHLGMFNFYGDPNWRHNMAKSPELILPVGILFLIGIFVSLKKIKEYPYLILIAWFLVMLLPGILTREGVPHSLRVIGTIPVVFIFVGIGADLISEKMKKVKKYSNLLKNAGILILILIAIWEGYRYFFVWAKKPEVKSEFTRELVEMGNYLNSLPEDVKKYVIVNRGGIRISWANNLPIPAQTLMFIEISKYGKTNSEYLLPERINEIKIEKRGIILFLEKEENLLKKVLEIYPNSVLDSKNEFWVLKVNL